jgi:hypothetical protein
LSFVSLIGGPFFSIMISNIASASLLNRYNMYLHKELGINKGITECKKDRH